MRIKVNPHSIKIIERESVNEKEININKCYFEFSEEITNDYVKEAYFTLGENTYKQIIQNNECDIPYEVLEQKGKVEIGVVAFKVEDEETIKRYNPMPTTINTLIGSLKEADNSEPVTPSDKEQMEQMLQDGLEDIQEAIAKAERVDITATKTGTITTITITKQDGTTETVHVDDGVGLQFRWEGTSLGVKREDQEHYEYVNLKGEKGDAGSIKFIVVQELPTEDIDTTAIYLVPLEEPESQENRYAEYIYVNNQWELLGKIGIEVDLSNYYTKQEVNTELAKKQPLINNDNKLPYSLISGTPDLTDYVKNTDYATSSKGGVLKTSAGLLVNASNGNAYCEERSYAQYQSSGGTAFISKGTLENVITGKELVNKTYVDGLVGDIESILETIDVGSGI